MTVLYVGQDLLDCYLEVSRSALFDICIGLSVSRVSTGASLIGGRERYDGCVLSFDVYNRSSETIE